MKIAYLIIAHKNPEQIKRMIRSLYRDNNYFIIHYDKKVSDSEYNYLKEILKKYNNVYYLEPRISIYWAHFTLVKVTLLLINELLNKNIDFDYAFLISGEHYPIKNKYFIEKFLEKNSENSFMEYEKIPRKYVWLDEKGGLDRIEKWYFLVHNSLKVFPNNQYLFKIFKRNFPKTYIPHGGGEWWCLKKELLNYINEFIKKNKKFVKFFKHVKYSDEIFFQTVLLNSKYKYNIVNNNLLYTDWSKRIKPAVLDESYLNDLINSNCLFARKFNTNINIEILNKIDNLIIK